MLNQQPIYRVGLRCRTSSWPSFGESVTARTTPTIAIDAQRRPDMSTISTTAESSPSGFFRCRVEPIRGDATICVGRKKIPATVQETAIDGFTILVAPKHASSLKVGKPWTLEHDETRIEVHPLWFFNTPDGQVQLGLRRLNDITKPEDDRNSLLIRFGGSRFRDPNCSAAAYGGIVLTLICLLALPGWGDHMGTSDRIQDGFKWLVDGLDDTFGKYL